MEINCDKIVDKYILIQNPLYSFSFPISILVSIIVFGVAKAYKWSNNSYINQILIPILALLLTMVLLDIISRMMISKNEKMKLTHLCKQWMHDPSSKKLNKLIDMNEISKYKVENFIGDNVYKKENENEHIKKTEYEHKNEHKYEEKNSVEYPISEIPHISPFPLPFKKEGDLCIENSNGCNLCSGSDKNPYNLVAPIPGPQWLPQSAEAVQNRLVNNDYTKSKC
jgi:hypothetical protein